MHMTTEPAHRRDYIGPVTDTRIWADFERRPGDVVLSTPPKCGTTWSQAILMMLLHGSAVTDRAVWRDSVWLDCGFRDQAAAKQMLDAQPHRRCIKSHTPLDGIPYDPDLTYITVYRHPVDVHFSMEKHVSNMVFDILDFMYPDAPGAAFERFLTAPATDAGTDDLTLASYLQHYRSFSAYAHLPNIHFFHYADLKADPAGQIRRYAAALGITCDDALVAEIVAATSFGAMKEVTKHDQRPPGQGAFKNESQFFHSATSNKWVGRLSDAEVAAYRDRISRVADPEAVHWLENGTLGCAPSD